MSLLSDEARSDEAPRNVGRMLWIALLCAGALAGCDARLSREDRYTGPVAPEGPCGRTRQGTLTVAGGHFTFAPDDGVLILTGSVTGDGAIAGQLVTTGADKKPFVMTLAARLGPEQVIGSYVTPRCRFQLTLTRVHPALL